MGVYSILFVLSLCLPHSGVVTSEEGVNKEDAAGVLPITALELSEPAASPATQAEQEFLSWLSQQGASYGPVTLARSAAGVRGVFAIRTIKKGELLVAVPDRLLVKLPNKDPGETGVLMMLALLELENNNQFLPFLEVLPTLEESAKSPDTFHLPKTYWPLLQSDIAVSFLEHHQTKMELFWQHQGGTFEALGGSLERLRYALWLVFSRCFFHHTDDTVVIVPLADMLNHVNGCPTKSDYGPCPTDPQQICFIMTAGEDIPAGSEVCNTYGTLHNDKAFLYYGFNLDEVHATERLFIVDLPDADIFTFSGEAREPSDPGSTADVERELQRLTMQLQLLQGLDAEAAAWPPAEEDPERVVLEQVLQWRRLRQRAIQTEVSRLKQVLDQRHSAGTDSEQAASLEAEYYYYSDHSEL